MTRPVERDESGHPVRLVVGLVLTPLIGWKFWSANATGEIYIRARGGSKGFVADRLTDPDQFCGGMAILGLVFLISLGALLSVVWDFAVGYRRDAGLN